MRAVAAIAAVVLGLMGPTTFVAAQSWGGSEYGDRDRGYRDRDRGYGERDRDRGYRERDRGYGERDRGYGGRRVQVSRKWSGKTLTEHRADRASVVRETLAAAGYEARPLDDEARPLDDKDSPLRP